jgi:hypothetical protein
MNALLLTPVSRYTGIAQVKSMVLSGGNDAEALGVGEADVEGAVGTGDDAAGELVARLDGDACATGRVAGPAHAATSRTSPTAHPPLMNGQQSREVFGY